MDRNTAVLNSTGKKFEIGFVSLIDGHILATYKSARDALILIGYEGKLSTEELASINNDDAALFWIEDGKICGFESDPACANIKKEMLRHITIRHGKI